MAEYKIKLDIFEGPLDLLLHLIKEEELDIRNIPIAKITKQYFEYLDIMKDLNLEVAGEFLVMAATLTYIKSKMLLPSKQTEDDEETGEDPREELVRKLIEYKKYKEAANSMRDMEEEQSNSFSRSFVSEWDEEDPDYLKEVSVVQLLSAFRKIYKKLQGDKLYEISLEEISVTEKMSEIMEVLISTPRMAFEDLFQHAYTRLELIGTFLALLELAKQTLIRVYQENEFGNIWIKRTEEDDQRDGGSVEGGLPNEEASTDGDEKTADEPLTEPEG